MGTYMERHRGSVNAWTVLGFVVPSLERNRVRNKGGDVIQLTLTGRVGFLEEILITDGTTEVKTLYESGASVAYQITTRTVFSPPKQWMAPWERRRQKRARLVADRTV